MNRNQRTGLYISGSAVLIVLFLHSPWTGYGEFYVKYLPFLEWHTVSPLVEWLGSVKNTLASIALVIMLATIWTWFARTLTPNSSQTEEPTSQSEASHHD